MTKVTWLEPVTLPVSSNDVDVAEYEMRDDVSTVFDLLTSAMRIPGHIPLHLNECACLRWWNVRHRLDETGRVETDMAQEIVEAYRALLAVAGSEFDPDWDKDEGALCREHDLIRRVCRDAGTTMRAITESVQEARRILGLPVATAEELNAISD